MQGFSCQPEGIHFTYKHKHLRAAFTSLPVPKDASSSISTKVQGSPQHQKVCVQHQTVTLLNSAPAIIEDKSVNTWGSCILLMVTPRQYPCTLLHQVWQSLSLDACYKSLGPLSSCSCTSERFFEAYAKGEDLNVGSYERHGRAAFGRYAGQAVKVRVSCWQQEQCKARSCLLQMATNDQRLQLGWHAGDH